MEGSQNYNYCDTLLRSFAKAKDGYRKPLKILGVENTRVRNEGMRAVCVFHYHFRPSGVRSVVDRTLPLLLKQVLQTDRVVFITGEEPDPDWFSQMQGKLAPRKVSIDVVPQLSYLAEQTANPDEMRRGMKEALHRLFLRHRPKLLWAHNLSVGRNPVAGVVLDELCQMHGSVLFCHHHDWWPELRWQRYAEMKHRGIDSAALVGRSTCPEGAHVRHAAVHPRDAEVLGAHVGLRSIWMPNLGPAEEFKPKDHELASAASTMGSLQPYWLMPTRLLGRKNPLEALLMARLLGAKHFAVLGGPSSGREAVYATLLEQAAAALNMRVTVNLAGVTGLRPGVLMGMAEGCVQSSVVEGWGIPGSEAALLKKPFVLRKLAELEQVPTPFAYQELVLPEAPSEEERNRREVALERARECLPPWWRDIFSSAHAEKETPWFSHLSPKGQLEYLTASQANDHAALREANPWISEWQTLLKENPEASLPKPDTNPMDQEEIWLNRFQQVLEARGPIGNSEHILSDIFSRCSSSAKAWPWLVDSGSVQLS